jgi:hypothetical protein
LKFKPTILNIASILLIIIDNYIYWTSYLKGEIYEYGFIALILSFIVGFLGLLIDFVLQKVFKNYWIINGIGFVLLLLFTIISFYNSRVKTIILPNYFSGPFTIVYGVKEANPLFKSNPTFGYKLEITKTRVLYTETLLTDDLWNTKFQTKSGLTLDKDQSNPRVIDLKLGKFNCKGKEWEYRTWLVKSNNQFIEIKNIDSITIKNIVSYCNNKH